MLAEGFPAEVRLDPSAPPPPSASFPSQGPPRPRPLPIHPAQGRGEAETETSTYSLPRGSLLEDELGGGARRHSTGSSAPRENEFVKNAQPTVVFLLKDPHVTST